MADTIDLSQKPYHDTYNEKNKQYKILFRPSRALQVRELNELQSMLQQQIERIGSHLFEQGAQVLPGNSEGIKYVNGNGWIKIPRTDFADDETQLTTYWLNKVIKSVGGPLNIKAQVVGFRAPDSIDEARLYIKYLSADTDTGDQTEFLPGQDIQTDESVPVSATIVPTNAVGKISSVIVEEGVYFFNGNFLLVDKQEIFLIPDDTEDQTSWTNSPTALVGLKITESIVTSDDDPSLLDNASGSPNFSAPGADRLAISADLQQKGINDQEQSFISLVEIVDGTVRLRVTKTDYSVIGDTLARRTFDESGDYTVRPFTANVKDFLNEDNNGGAHNEKEFYYNNQPDAKAASVAIFGVASPGTAVIHPDHPGVWIPGTSYDNFLDLCRAKLSLVISPGKAYVKGYEIEKIATNIVDIDRARTLKFVNNKTIFTPLGTFIYVTNTYGTPDLVNYDLLELHSKYTTTPGISPNAKIGTARALAVTFFSGINGSPSSTYQLFIFDVELDAGYDSSDIKAMYSGSPTFTCDTLEQDFRLTGSVSKTNSDGTPAAANVLVGIGTSWRNDAAERVTKGDYVRVGAGPSSVLYYVTLDPDTDNQLNVTPDPQAATWADGSTIDLVFNTIESNSPDPSLVFLLPDAFLNTIRGGEQGAVNPSIVDTNYTSKRVVADGVGVSSTTDGAGHLTFNLSDPNEEFAAFSPLDYLVIRQSNGDWIEVLPYVAGTPGSGQAEIKPVGNQLTIYTGVASEEFYVVASVIRNGGSAGTERAKNLIDGTSKGFFDGFGVYNGPSVVTAGSNVSQISLGKADVLRITRVVESPDYNTIPSNLKVLPAGHKEITGAYILDSGQRDYFYDIATANLRPGTRPQGQVRIEFDYFVHGNTGNYFSVDSYPWQGPSATMKYEDIPVFSSTNGIQYHLGDCIDFRPKVNEPGGIAAGFATNLEVPRESFRADYHFFQGRSDKLYLDKEGVFLLKSGIPDQNPQSPAEPSTGMTTHNLDLLPYTATPSELSVAMVDNRRYTMRDIGKLDRRISTLENYTLLTLLEKNAADLVIPNAIGQNKFKNGFLTDNFASFTVADLGNPDYRAAIDTVAKELRPIVYQANISLFEKYLLETNLPNRDALRAAKNYQVTGDIYSLPYEEEVFVEQSFASKVSTVNPYDVFTYSGTITLTPWSDEWADTDTLEPLNVQDSGTYDAISKTYGPSGTTINPGFTFNNVIGVDVSSKKVGKETVLQAGHTVIDKARKQGLKVRSAANGKIINVPKGYANAGRPVDVGTTTVVSRQVQTTTTVTTQDIQVGLQSTLQDLGFTTPIDLGERVVDISIAPYIRSREIKFSGQALMPNAKLYAFFDNVDVSVYCKPDGGNYGDPLICDNFGNVKGTFKIPNNADTGVRFLTGTRTFRLTTSVTNATTPAPVSWASAQYTASGTVSTKQATTYSTRAYKVDNSIVNQTGTTRQLSDSSITGAIASVIDPIAQSFFVYEDGGCFVRYIDVYFYKRPTDANKPQPPVRLQLRALDDGGNPSINILPGGEVTKQAYEVVTNFIDLSLGTMKVSGHSSGGTPGVDTGPWTPLTPITNKSGRVIQDGVSFQLGTVPTDDMIPTRFYFDFPVYIQKNYSYCFVLLSDSSDYNVWVAQSGPDVTGRDGVDTFREQGVVNTNIGTSDKITKDPYIGGVYFKSQNSISWTADQSMDIKFAIAKCLFDTDTNGEVEFVNESLPYRALDLDPIQTLNGSHLIRIDHPAHGMLVSSPAPTRVILAGITGTTNGINLSALQNVAGLPIVATETDSYILDVGAGNEATSSGHIGGPLVAATENKRFEELIFLTTPLILPETNITWNIQLTDSAGVNDSSNSAYGVEPRINVEPNNKLVLTKPAQVSSDINEQRSGDIPAGPSQSTGSGFGDHKSLNIRAVLSSTNPNVSPIIDSSRLSALLIDNRMDDPHGVAAPGVPTNSIINIAGFDDFVCLPTTSNPAVNPVPTNKIHFSTSTGLLSGTTFSSSGVIVTATGSPRFLAELDPGDTLKNPTTGQEVKVISIQSNSSLTTDIPFSPALSGSSTLLTNPPELKIKTADTNIAIHLSKLGVGKLLTVTGATGDRNFSDKVILKVDYTPNNLTNDPDFSPAAPALCTITVDYKPTQAAGLQSGTSLNFTQKDRFIDEVAPHGGSCSAKYVHQALMLASEANTLKILFDANRHESVTIDVYYRLLNPNSNSAELLDKNWIKADFNLDPNGSGNLILATPSPDDNSSSFKSYEVNLIGLPTFIGAQSKVVIRGGNPARPGRLRNYQVIALES